MVQLYYAGSIDAFSFKFQYIKCDGSADSRGSDVDIILSFQYIKCDGSAMKKYATFQEFLVFQYIKCDGSAFYWVPFYAWIENFNTSNVMVQRGNPGAQGIG